MQPPHPRTAGHYTRVMLTLSLKWIALLLGIIVAGGMITLVVVGTITATESVTEVAEELRDSLAARAIADINRFLVKPTEFSNRVLRMADSEAFNFQRPDGKEIPLLLRQFTAQYVADYEFDGSIYLVNELGHFVGLMARGEENGTFATTTQPPMEQLIEGNPTWMIPCRYNASCDNSTGYCVPQDFWKAEGREEPFWVAGNGTYKGAEALGYYREHHYEPEYARWAASRTALDRNQCRGVSKDLGPKPPCADGPCPEFNRTYYINDINAENRQYVRSRHRYDHRNRRWYLESKALPRYSKHVYMILCSSGFPCLTSVQQWREDRYGVGSTVKVAGELGVVVDHAHTEQEMFSPVVELTGGARLRMPSHLITPVATTVTNFILGIVAADYETSALKLLFDKVKVAKTGGLFLVEKDPQALLISTGYPCEANTRGLECFSKPQQDDIEADPERVSTFDAYAGPMPSSVMQELYSPKKNSDGKWVSAAHQGITTVVDETVTVRGSKHWVKISPITGPPGAGITGINWLLYIVIPQDDYMEMIEERTTVLLTASICTVAAIVSALMVLVVFGFVRPIVNMSHDFELACLMNLDAIEADTGNLVSEISYLQTHFGTLVSNLKMYRPFLPPSCLPGTEEDPNELETEADMSHGRTRSARSEVTRTRTQGFEKSSVVLTSSRQSDPSSETARNMGAARLGISALTSSQVVVLSSNVVGFRKAYSPATLPETHAEYLEKVLACVQTRKGVAEPFCGDRVTVSWNGSIPSAFHTSQLRATEAALQIAAVSFAQCKTVVGVTGGQALCGVLGTHSMRRYSLIGDIVGKAAVLMNLNKFFNSTILIDETLHDMVGYSVDLLFKDRLARAKSRKRMKVWEVTGMKNVQEDEWMYQLECPRGEGSQNERFKHNNDWMQYLRGEVDTDYSDITTPAVLEQIRNGVLGKDYCGKGPEYLDVD